MTDLQDVADATDNDEQTTDTPEVTEETPAGDQQETFPRAYVEKLRKEAGDARTKAKRADDLATRLHTALVTATGRLADPTDLPFDPEHLDDPEALAAAVDDLLARKPHLASRKVTGDVGQGASRSGDTVDLAGMLRARA